jgi:hypothetical protein
MRNFSRKLPLVFRKAAISSVFFLLWTSAIAQEKDGKVSHLIARIDNVENIEVIIVPDEMFFALH